jgi:CheY-like chemotaxis protein
MNSNISPYLQNHESYDYTKKLNLLLIEDDVDNQQFFRTLLQKVFNIDICDSSESFYELLAEKFYDIFLVDISIKGTKNGLILISELRQSPEYKNAAIICLTAHAFDRDREAALKAGADLYFSKPVPNQTLIDGLLEVYKFKNKNSEIN